MKHISTLVTFFLLISISWSNSSFENPERSVNELHSSYTDSEITYQLKVNMSNLEEQDERLFDDDFFGIYHITNQSYMGRPVLVNHLVNGNSTYLFYAHLKGEWIFSYEKPSHDEWHRYPNLAPEPAMFDPHPEGYRVHEGHACYESDLYYYRFDSTGRYCFGPFSLVSGEMGGYHQEDIRSWDPTRAKWNEGKCMSHSSWNEEWREGGWNGYRFFYSSSEDTECLSALENLTLEWLDVDGDGYGDNPAYDWKSSWDWQETCPISSESTYLHVVWNASINASYSINYRSLSGSSGDFFLTDCTFNGRPILAKYDFNLDPLDPDYQYYIFNMGCNTWILTVRPPPYMGAKAMAGPMGLSNGWLYCGSDSTDYDYGDHWDPVECSLCGWNADPNVTMTWVGHYPYHDVDNDGVNNTEDDCHNTGSNWTVDTRGCAQNQLDDDGDGVVNTLDECPNEIGASSLYLGCLDSDEDDILEGDDLCQDTDRGLAVNSDGCATNQLDGDLDGIMDDADVCPNTHVNGTQWIDKNGCVADWWDSDRDGVTNQMDICSDTNSTMPVDEQGCSENQREQFSTDSDSFDPMILIGISALTIIGLACIIIWKTKK